jgi:hypothetical protein
MQSFEEYAKYILDHAGHNKINKRNQVHIIVDYPQLEWGDFKKYLMTLTWMTGIGWSRGGNDEHNVIFAKTLDEGAALADEYDYALVSYVGTVYRFPASSSEYSIYHYLDKWIERNDSPCRGHILWHPDKQYGRMHLQSMFLNLRHWRDIDRPTFGKWSGGVTVPKVSPDNIHDDYTPTWLQPGTETREVVNAEMAEYISAVVAGGDAITNFTAPERSSKYFTYPQREELSAPLVADRQKSPNIIYRRNTSKLSQIDKISITRKYDVIYAPAAGNVAEYLWKRFGHENSKLIIVDNHGPSLKWKDGLFNLYGVRSVNDLERVTKIVANVYDSRIDDATYKPAGFIEENDSIFSDVDWIEVIDQIKDVEIEQFDYFTQTLHVDPTKSNLIYLTNIFSYIFSYHKYSLEHMNEQFNKLLDLPNTTVVGQTPFRLNVLHENHSS